MISDAESRSDHESLLRGAAKAVQNRDIDGLVELCHPDVEWIPFMAALEGRTYRGLAGVRRMMEELYENLGPFRVIVEEIEEHPRGRMLAIGRFRGEGPASGVPVDRPFVQLFTIEDGKIARVRTCSDLQAARKELGTGA